MLKQTTLELCLTLIKIVKYFSRFGQRFFIGMCKEEYQFVKRDFTLRNIIVASARKCATEMHLDKLIEEIKTQDCMKTCG